MTALFIVCKKSLGDFASHMQMTPKWASKTSLYHAFDKSPEAELILPTSERSDIPIGFDRTMSFK